MLSQHKKIMSNWIWYPEQRSLPCTFIFFRKEIDIVWKRGQATGKIAADSRYQLFVNGVRIQRGPAPFDPRYQELDPVDLSAYLKPGKNCIGIMVFSFGHAGDGTYIPGVPGLRFELEINNKETCQWIYSDKSWKVHRATCWPAGHHRRSYLRAFQEEFDARKYPDGWASIGFNDKDWLQAKELDILANLPLISKAHVNTMAGHGTINDTSYCYLRQRTIPFLKEERILCSKLSASGKILWKINPHEYFEAYTENAFFEHVNDTAAAPVRFPYNVKTSESGTSEILLFEFKEEVVGFPYLILEAEAGTVVELVFSEKRESGVLLPRELQWKGQFVRLICKDGINNFEAFDWEAVKYLAVLIRNNTKPVKITEVGVNRISYPFMYKADFKCSDRLINKVFGAALNTCRNLSFETVVDNVARERQQYSGEVAQTYISHYLAHGEYRLARRCLLTLADGQHPEGWFFDCYPAIDRMERMWQNALELFKWGSLLDHGLGYIFHLYSYVLYSGDKTLLYELKDKIIRFSDWLKQVCEQHGGLLDASEGGSLSVWMDTKGFIMQRHKTAALNIYYYGVLSIALKNIGEWLKLPELVNECTMRSIQLKKSIKSKFLDHDDLFVDNLPWLMDENNIKRYHDRTLSMALLFGLISDPRSIKKALKYLVECPDNMGLSHPPNAYWRLWALNKFDCKNIVIKELRNRWGQMSSLATNNTFSEQWNEEMGPNSALCQCACSAPIYAIYNGILGVKPLSEGFNEYEIKVLLNEIENYSATVYVPGGNIKISLKKELTKTFVEFNLPPNKTAKIILSTPVIKAWKNDECVTDEFFSLKELILNQKCSLKIQL